MNTIYRLPEIHASKTELISQVGFIAGSRPVYENKYYKLVFFLLREGWKRSIKKVLSKKKAEKLSEQQYLTTIKTTWEKEEYYNFSTQYTNDISNFIICNKFYKLDDASLRALQLKYDTNPVLYNQFNPHEIDYPSVELPIRAMNTIAINKPVFKEGIFLVGLGDYSRTYIAPHLRSENKIACIDYNINLGIAYKKSFNFKASYNTVKESLSDFRDTTAPLAIIASYHSDHSRIANQYYEQNREGFLFIEKPPCVTFEDVRQLITLYNQGAKIEIGFNRRYIDFNKRIADNYKNAVKIISLSVKEVNINSSHWYFWSNQGTRITGNLVHWIDLCNYWINGLPEELNLISSKTDRDTLALSIRYSDGSLANITVSDMGNSLRGVQERIELRMDEETILINDYTNIQHFQKNGLKKRKR